jgi:hypothetical protein
VDLDKEKKKGIASGFFNLFKKKKNSKKDA